MNRASPRLAGDASRVRTALTVEPRDGRLVHLHAARCRRAGDYFALLSAVEDAAEALGVAVHIEGYPPPYDPRINVIKVTPDPGVIEVNIHPAKNWREQVDITKALYEEAAACRLSHREIPARWPPHRHRRRQSYRGGRGRRRPTVPSCAGPTC